LYFYICFDENNVNRTCILKLLIRKKIFLKFSKTIFKKIDTLFQKNRAMAKNLVIVESLQRRTIEKFLGDFQVESSYGHIADLPSKEIG
jgi:hypothetical protein